MSGACFLGLGVVAGSLLARGVPWNHGDLLGAHMSLNLAGWFGAAIVGTLHTFFPSLTQAQLRFPRLQGVAFIGWTGGVAALAAGYGWALEPLALAGWLGLCAGAIALLVNVAACLGEAARPLSLPARIVGVAQPFLLAGLLVATVSAIEDGPLNALTGSARATVGTLLVSGWIGLTVLGSLTHLLAVVVRVRGGFAARMPAPRPRLDRLIAALAMVGIVALALWQSLGLDGWRSPALAVLLAAHLDELARLGSLVSPSE